MSGTAARSGAGHRLACALALVAAGPATAQGVVERFAVEWPRDFGYQLGDVFEVKVQLAIAASHVLVVDGLPEAGRISRWLEMDAPEVVGDEHGEPHAYAVLFRYRFVAAPTTVQAVEVPPRTLEVAGPKHSFALAVPALQVSVTPLLALEADIEGVPMLLRAPRAPPPIDARPMHLRIAVLVAATALVLGWLAWLHLRVPWLAAGNGPFARAERDLARLARAGGDEAWRAALTRVHRAFDETAGRTLFETDVGRFVAEQRRFARLEQAIAGFYALSRRCFFQPAGSTAEATTADLAELRRLCRLCRDAERGVA